MRLRVLISFHYFKKANVEKIIGDNIGDAPWPDVWADSGAFSAFTKGYVIQPEDYAEWLAKWRHLFTTACNLDVIGDAVGTLRNQERLEDLGATVLPVYHMRANRWDLFDEILDRGYPYICLGGMAGTKVALKFQVRFAANAMLHAQRHTEQHGTAQPAFHGLGLAGDTALRHLPLYSADSSTWNSPQRFGYYELWDDDRGKMQYVPAGHSDKLGRWAGLVRLHGVEPRDLMPNPPAQGLRDRVSIRAYFYRERWLHAHRLPVYRPDQPDSDDPGPRIYLAMANEGTLAAACRVAAWWTEHDRSAA